MKKLAALLIFGASVTIGGVTYVLFQPRQDTTLAELLDAGFGDVCNPALVACEGRLDDDCRTRPDGGLRPRYVTLRLQAFRCVGPDGGAYLWPRLPRARREAVRDCFEPLRSFAEDCDVLEADTCSDSSVCAAGLDESPAWAGAQDKCACRRIPAAGGGACAVPVSDGGVRNIPFGTTAEAPFGGAGCVRKPCVEALGEQGQSMPVECGGAP